MQLSITTDYAKDTGCPEPYLRRIAEAGFTHTHWCHQWNTDFLYSKWEIAQTEEWLKEFRLTLLDLHASDGVEKKWTSPREYERQSGVDLVKNRIDMTARLSSDVIIMHAGEPKEEAQRAAFWAQLRRSLDDLRPHARARGVRIAIENGNFAVIRALCSEYEPDFLGLCYDCGHGNMGDHTGLDHLDALKDRLISIHLHDNDGVGDQHKLLFTGTVDWPRLAAIIAKSSYKKCVSMEVTMRNMGISDEQAFLAEAFKTGTVFSEMVSKGR